MADNDLADLNSALDVQLKDTTDVVWTSAEKDELLKQSVHALWPRFSRPLDPTATTITIVADTYYYSLPSGVTAVSRIDLLDADSEDRGPIHGRAWELTGDVLSGSGKLHVGPTYVKGYVGGTLRLHGYGKYDTATNLIPWDFRALVLAQARAEAYRRVAADRVKFEEWLARNQTQNVSVNELVQFINEADAEAQRLRVMTPRTWQKPVEGRV